MIKAVGEDASWAWARGGTAAGMAAKVEALQAKLLPLAAAFLLRDAKDLRAEQSAAVLQTELEHFVGLDSEVDSLRREVRRLMQRHTASKRL